MGSGDRDRARGKRKKKNTAKAFCQYLPVCPRSPGALYLFRQSSWLSGLRPAAFLLRALPIGRSFAGEGGRELFLQKVPSSGPIPFLVKFLFVKRLQTFLGEKADFVAGFFQLLAAGAGERQPFLVQANAVLKRKFAVFQRGDDFLKAAQPDPRRTGFSWRPCGLLLFGDKGKGIDGDAEDIDPKMQVRAGHAPVAPTRPICCPALTISPGFTSRRDMCA